jgi:gas vesicle protein
MMGERNLLVPMGFSLLTGLLIGGFAGLLYAPQSGSRTRRQIANFAEDMKERAGEMAEDATVVVNKMVDNGRRFVNV